MGGLGRLTSGVPGGAGLGRLASGVPGGVGLGRLTSGVLISVRNLIWGLTCWCGMEHCSERWDGPIVDGFGRSSFVERQVAH